VTRKWLNLFGCAIKWLLLVPNNGCQGDSVRWHMVVAIASAELDQMSELGVNYWHWFISNPTTTFFPNQRTCWWTVIPSWP